MNRRRTDFHPGGPYNSKCQEWGLSFLYLQISDLKAFRHVNNNTDRRQEMLKGRSFWKPGKRFPAYRNDLPCSCSREVLRWEQATPSSRHSSVLSVAYLDWLLSQMLRIRQFRGKLMAFRRLLWGKEDWTFSRCLWQGGPRSFLVCFL